MSSARKTRKSRTIYNDNKKFNIYNPNDLSSSCNSNRFYNKPSAPPNDTESDNDSDELFDDLEESILYNSNDLQINKNSKRKSSFDTMDNNRLTTFEANNASASNNSNVISSTKREKQTKKRLSQSFSCDVKDEEAKSSVTNTATTTTTVVSLSEEQVSNCVEKALDKHLQLQAININENVLKIINKINFKKINSLFKKTQFENYMNKLFTNTFNIVFLILIIILNLISLLILLVMKYFERPSYIHVITLVFIIFALFFSILTIIINYKLQKLWFQIVLIDNNAVRNNNVRQEIALRLEDIDDEQDSSKCDRLQNITEHLRSKNSTILHNLLITFIIFMFLMSLLSNVFFHLIVAGVFN